MESRPRFEGHTIEQGKKFLRQNWKGAGVECPCCTQFVKLYQRRIYGMPARLLISLFFKDLINPDKFFHNDELTAGITLKGPGDFSKLKLWKLIQKKPNDDTTKSSSGMWRITDLGRAYVQGKIKLPKYANVYNKRLYAFEGPELNIVDALGKNFDYQKLMKPHETQ